MSITNNFHSILRNKTGILLEGGNMFVSNGDNYIRINLAPRAIIKEGLERIKNAL